MGPDLYPKPPGRLFFAYVPLMLNKGHCLLNAFGRQGFTAAQPNQTQLRKPVAGLTNAKSFWKPLHIRIDSDKDRVICKRRGGDHVVRSFFRQGISV